jgi:hypothetical protein
VDLFVEGDHTMHELPILTIMATQKGVREIDISCAETGIDGVRLHSAILPIVKTIDELIEQARLKAAAEVE